MAIETQTPPPAVDIREIMRRRGLKEWLFKVVETSELTPRMRRVTLTADDLDGFDPKGGRVVAAHGVMPPSEGSVGVGQH